MAVKTKRTLERLVVLRNPSSTHAERSAELTAGLVKLFGERRSTIIDTEKEPEAFYKQLMARPSLLGERTLLAVAGGDGTVSQAVNALLDERTDPAVARTVVLPLWGGNANDLAHMLNGPPNKVDIKAIVKDGTVVDLRPMVIAHHQVGSKGSTGAEVSHLATNYISFGASAAAAKAINKKGHRKSRLHAIPGGRIVKELATIIKAMAVAPRFRIREDGETFRVYERVMINGPRFAKVERVALDLLEPKFSMATVERKRTRSLIYHGLLLANGRHRSEMTTEKVRFIVLDPVAVQIDGESIELSAGTDVRVEIAKQPLRVLGTRVSAGSGSQ